MRHRVTASEGNVIEALDGHPALDVFLADIGADAGRDLRRAADAMAATFAEGAA